MPYPSIDPAAINYYRHAQIEMLPACSELCSRNCHGLNLPAEKQ